MTSKEYSRPPIHMAGEPSCIVCARTCSLSRPIGPRREAHKLDSGRRNAGASLSGDQKTHPTIQLVGTRSRARVDWLEVAGRGVVENNTRWR